MPRQRRVVIPGIAHHVTQRGNNRRNVFFTDEDRELYLSLLTEYTAQYGVGVIGYCLMTNHVHLIVMPGCATALAKALGRTHSDYARWLPIRRRESEHLWQNRFFSCPLEPVYIWAALAYVERNAVRAGLVSECEAWPWSSALPHLNNSRQDDWLDVVLWSQHWTPALWRTAIREGLAEAEMRGRLHEATRTGRPLGEDDFVERCQHESGLSLRKQKPGPKPKAPLVCSADQRFDYEEV